MLENAWTAKETFQVPEPLNQNNFEHGGIVNPDECTYDKNWSYSIPDWNKLKGKKRELYMDSPFLWTTHVGAELSLEFNGTAVGAFILSGPDAGCFEVSIDGGPFELYDPYTKYSKNLHYPHTIMFANDLEEGKHTLELKMLKESSGTGNALRIWHFSVN